MPRPHRDNGAPALLSSGGVRTNAGSPRSGWGFSTKKSIFSSALFLRDCTWCLLAWQTRKPFASKYSLTIFSSIPAIMRKSVLRIWRRSSKFVARRGGGEENAKGFFGKNFIRDFRNLRSCGKAQRNGRGKIWLRKKCGLQSREINGGGYFGESKNKKMS